MNTALARAANDYRLVSIREARAPAGANGIEWHRYEIIQGPNTIVGYREGSIESVTTAVEEIVLQLNERRLDRRGRVHIKLKNDSAAGSGKT
jgi:hypothetical protein